MSDLLLHAMAKPIFDLKVPFFASLTNAYGEWMTEAANLTYARDDSVRPIYALDERSQRLTQVGSGVLLSFGGQMFCCSASHVFDAVGSYPLAIGYGDKIHTFGGDRFSTKHGPSRTHNDDPIDASVFHFTADVPPEVRSLALNLADLDIGCPPRALDRFVVCGYRVSQSRSTSEQHSTQLNRYPTIEANEAHYDHLKRDREMHLVLAFEDHVPIDGSWSLAPSLTGMSGGAIFRVVSTAKSPADASSALKIRLAATLIERRQKLGRGFLSVAIGTRLAVHFGLIDKYLPELHLGDALHDEYHRQLG